MTKTLIPLTTVSSLFVLAALLLAAFVAKPDQDAHATSAADRDPTIGRKSPQHNDSKHAYHEEPPQGPLPATLDPLQFRGNKAAVVVYSIAAKIRDVLYQEPCYCFCDKTRGHGSLLDCFTERHAVECHLCQRGAIFAYEQWKLGKTSTQIRTDMGAGLEAFDRTKYIETHYEEYKQPK